MIKGASATGKALFIVFFVAMNLCPSAGAAFKYLREGMSAPEVEGTDIRSGETVTTRDWLDDNMVVVLFWATWSERSLEEMENLSQFVQGHPDLSLKIVAVNVDGQELTAAEKQAVQNLVVEMDPAYPVIMDEGLEIFYEFGVIAVPSTAILDTTGILRYGPSGYSLTTHDRIVDSIEVILGLRQARPDELVDTGYQPTKAAGRYCNLALNQINRQQYRRALQNLERASQSDPKFGQPYVLKGETYLALDSLEPARIAFQTATSLDTGSVAAWTGLGMSFLLAEQFDSAFVYLATASRLDNTYTPAVLSLGLCLAEQGDLEAGLDSLTQALDLNPRDPRVHYYLGQLHRKADDLKLAVEAYMRALELVYPSR